MVAREPKTSPAHRECIFPVIDRVGAYCIRRQTDPATGGSPCRHNKEELQYGNQKTQGRETRPPDTDHEAPCRKRKSLPGTQLGCLNWIRPIGKSIPAAKVFPHILQALKNSRLGHERSKCGGRGEQTVMMGCEVKEHLPGTQ
jgi:hypothetical protein